MKHKLVIISLFFLVGLILSSLLSLTSLSIAKQIKNTFSEEKNELFEGFNKSPTREEKIPENKTSSELLEWLTEPPTGEIKFVEEKKDMEEVRPILNFKEKVLPSKDTSKFSLKGTLFSLLFVILLFLTILFIRSSYKKKNRISNNNIFAVEQEHTKLLKSKNRIEITSNTKKTRVETSIYIHEIRRLLQEWEARLVKKRNRKEAETINEWFERINGPVEIIHIYEKVRYGEQECTDEEVRFIKSILEL